MCDSDDDPSICGPTNLCSCSAAKLADPRPTKTVLRFGSSNRTTKKNVTRARAAEKRAASTAASLAMPSTSSTPRALSLAKILVAVIAYLPLMAAYPVRHSSLQTVDATYAEDPEEFWLNMSVSVVLVLLGGVFAGLTLGLMGQDELYLEVIRQSGDPKERKAAEKVLTLLARGKHWVLVTLLLGNVITNETLPIVLDRCLGGGWPAVASSTVAIVIFGEIIPQSVSVRYGLAVGSAFAPFVLTLMYLMYPIAYPISLLLDHILGENHGTVYKKSGLKTLVTLHKGADNLNEDEVTIISAVLDLKEKPVGTIMTPMEDVFVLSADTVLDEPTMEQILHTGFNRIPIHCPGEPENFIGMLLVRILITYDPEDALPISSFPLATLPETGPDTSCLNILNYFQEGKSHMIIVSESPGEPRGALGVLTLEDVIEELIGEEIVDESDVYIDVHKAIRRAHPGPLSKRSFSSPRGSMGIESVMTALVAAVGGSHPDSPNQLPKPKLGPSNPASNPIRTSSKKITVKSGHFEPHQLRQPNGPSNLIDTSLPVDGANGSTGYHESNSLAVPINAQLMAAPSEQNGSVTRTEAGAVQAAIPASYGRRTNTDHTGDLAYEDRVVSPALSENHSYRTGGIIESVVNVQGVNKVIIEEDDRKRRGSRKFGTSRASSRSNSGGEDTQPLLNARGNDSQDFLR